jgi:hypothetical protein
LVNSIDEINYKLLQLFLVDITELLRNKFEFMSQMNIPTTVVNTWYYWEFEEYVKLLNQKNKEEKEQREKSQKEQDDKYSGMSNFNPTKMMNKYNPKNFGGMGSNSAFPRF